MVIRPSLSLKAADLIVAAYWTFLGLLMAVALIVDKGAGVLWINGHHSPLMDEFFKAVTILGEGIVFVPILIITLFVQLRYTIITIAFLAGNGLLVSIFKRVLFAGLERPRAFLGDELIYFVPGVDVHNLHTFPSGHTATAFGAALLLSLLTKNKVVGIFTLLVATLVGYSRIYLAQHFLGDAVAGATIGTLTAFIVWRTLDTGRVPKWMSKKLGLPGHSTGTRQHG